MRDEEKTKEQLIEELRQLRSQVERLERPQGADFRAKAINALILDNITTGVWVTDGDDVVCYANRAMSRISGVTEGEIVGRHVLTEFPEETLRHFRPYYLRAKEGVSPVRYDDIPVTTLALRESYQSGWLIPIVVDAICTGVICTVDDITESKKIQEESEQYRVFMEAVLDCIDDGIAACDGDGVLRFFNRASQRIHGLPAEPLLPEQWADYYNLYLADGKTRMGKEDIPLFRALRGEDVTDIEVVIAPRGCPAFVVLVTGRTLIDSKGNRLGAVVSVHNITERKKAENELLRAHERLEALVQQRTAQLKSSEEKYRAFIQLASDAIFVANAETGIILEVNTMAERLLGMTREEIIGMHQRLLHPVEESAGDGGLSPMFIEHVMSGGSYQDEAKVIRKDGKVLYVSISSNVINLDSERLIVGIFRDITGQKIMQERLRKSEQRFRVVFEQAPLGIAIRELYTGMFIQINQAYCDILGCSRDEALSDIFKELTYPDDIRPELANMQCLISGEISMFNMEKRYIRKDSKVVWVSLTCVPLWIADERPVYHIAMAEDITDRKRMVEEIKIEWDKLKRIMETIQDGICIVTRGHDIEFVNDVVIRKFGPTGGRKCYEYFHGRTESCPWCRNEDVFSGKTVTWQWYSHREHKTYSILNTPIRNIDGSVSKFEIFHDISDIKNAQFMMKRELDFQRAVAELSEALLSPEKGIVDIAVIVNKQAMKLTGSLHGAVSEIDRETGEHVGHTHTEMVKDGLCSVDTRNRRLALPKGKDGYNSLCGHSLNTRQGFYTNNPQGHPAYKGCMPPGHVPLQRFLSVPAIINDRLIGQIALANAERDYTAGDLDIIKRLASIYAIAVDRKRMEEQLKELNTNLEGLVRQEIEKAQSQQQILIQQSKMAAMGEMIGLIAHQWKQPLNAVSIVVQDLKDAYNCGELDKDYIKRTVDLTMSQIQFMAKTIDDFKNFFKPSKKKVMFDVRNTIDELISMFVKIFRKNSIDIHVKAQQDLRLFADGYPNEFKQVILNILNNSRDAITLRRNTDARIQGRIDIQLSNNETRDQFIVSITDNGGGIPEDIMERIFDPYFTTKESEGTGIGLYMSKTIIETNMGGQLTVRNIDGGAEFTIALACS
ncbi:MAG: PAS domain S-box protein [Nitrospirae bacterium]|nr:PAS domain S-box protein [Nitrospirota bacterium]